LGLLFCCLIGCGNHTRAPIEDRYAQSLHSVYTVKKGDTLYSIAFRYGLDFRNVAKTNGIVVPYTIYPGQRISLGETVPPGQASAPGVKPAQSSQPIYEPHSHGSATTPVSPPISTVAIIPTAPVTDQSKPTAVESTVKPAPVVSPVTPPTKPKVAEVPYVGGKVTSWRWPASGPVTRGYSGSLHKGIDIGGKRGDPVIAAAAGKVVYAGTGIVGFGELLIIKHNDVYLSAYGHNDRLLVAEGQNISAGQTIAEKGSSGTDTVKLHFEIRKEGKPIDPQRLLPRR
jgi:lipoprotein NlpD